MKREHSARLFERASNLMPGGVNSPVRAFKAVDGPPLFMARGEGPLLWDEDGNQFIDFCCSWGPLILGHAPEAVLSAAIAAMQNGTSFGAPNKFENELAALIVENHRWVDKIRFVNSGTEAVMSAVRLARGCTGQAKLLKFEGCYHGHVDSLMVKAGSGLATLGTGSSAGITEAAAADTVVVELNDSEALEQAFKRWGSELACAIIEPIPANNGLLLQDRQFLLLLRKLCSQHGTLLLFDEVISGFRVGFEGAAGFFDIEPDLLTFGKIIGGGFPVGAYGGKAALMSQVAPEGPVYQAGTLSGNPVAMAAGAAQLRQCLAPRFYDDLNQKTDAFVSEINQLALAAGIEFFAHHVGSIFWLAFGDQRPVRRAAGINPRSGELFKKFYGALLDAGVYLGPSGYEVGFVSTAHSQLQLAESAAKIVKAALAAYS